MEFITIFCILLAMGFVLWLLGIAVLFAMKVIIGMSGAFFFGGKKMVGGLQETPSYLFGGDRICGRSDSYGETNVSVAKGPVNVSFNSDNSIYYLKKDGVRLESVKRYTDNNTIFSCYLTDAGFRAEINNLRLGERKTIEAENVEDMKCAMESCFLKWMKEDPGRHFTYLSS